MIELLLTGSNAPENTETGGINYRLKFQRKKLARGNGYHFNDWLEKVIGKSYLLIKRPGSDKITSCGGKNPQEENGP